MSLKYAQFQRIIASLDRAPAEILSNCDDDWTQDIQRRIGGGLSPGMIEINGADNDIFLAVRNMVVEAHDQC